MTKKAYPQILIIGTGGIGGLYGGLLYNVTKSVTLAANKDFPFVKKSGIKITREFNKRAFTEKEYKVTSDPEHIPKSRAA